VLLIFKKISSRTNGIKKTEGKQLTHVQLENACQTETEVVIKICFKSTAVILGVVKLICLKPVCTCCETKYRMQSRELMRQLTVQPTTLPLRSCTSPILSRWRFSRMLCKCRITSRPTQRTIGLLQWAANMTRVCELC